VILTDGPNDAVESVAQPFMIIGIAPGEAPKPEERDAFARRIFGTAPGIKEVKIIRAEPLRMGRSQGMSRRRSQGPQIGCRRDDGTVAAFRLVGYIQMFGIARRTAWNDTFTKMRAIRDGSTRNRA